METDIWSFLSRYYLLHIFPHDAGIEIFLPLLQAFGTLVTLDMTKSLKITSLHFQNN